MKLTDQTRPMLIGGDLRQSASGRVLESRNPATGELLARFPRAESIDIEAAVQAADAASQHWSEVPARERAAMVLALADLVVEHGDELAALDVADNGSPIREMSKDVQSAAAQTRYLAGLALQVRGETIPGDPGRLNYTLRSPFGVVGRIIPFNHPLMFAVCKSAAPLITGNTLVLKPSEHTSLSALRLGELAREVFPPGVLNIVTGLGDEAGEALVTHPLVRRLAFIGSVEIGRRIQRRAADVTVKTVTLELGGKNPIVVFPDADLELAVDGALRGMNFTWQGQSCGSTSRLLVHASVHRDFVDGLAERLSSLRSGLPDDPATETGAIVHHRQYEKVLDYLEQGKREGATLVAGGHPVIDPPLDRGMFIRPTLFDDVEPSSRLFNEEIFGPVMVALPFDDDRAALQLANFVAYGLTASVFTRDLTRAHQFARDVQAGYVWINDASTHFLGAPFGGVKDSGIGREEGLEELISYTQTKNVNVRFEAT